MIERMGTRVFKESKIKIKEFSILDDTISIHQLLLDSGLDIPKIISLKKKGDSIVKESEWIDGHDFFFLQDNRKITHLDYFCLGEFMAKMHNIKNEKGLSVANRDLTPRNILRTINGRVMLCDYAKLYLTDFPEEEVIRWILLNYNLGREFKEAFISGYSTQRSFNLMNLIKKEIWYNYDNYQDLYCNGELLMQGPRSNKRLKFLPEDMTGLKVLDLGCSCGMLAQESKRRGAEFVKAIDNRTREIGHRLIDLAGLIAFVEGLDIYFLCNDIENPGIIKGIKEDIYDIIFFCAMLGHLKTDGLTYLKMLRERCATLYFETNLGGKEAPHRKLLEDAGFKEIECLGESGDPDRDPCNTYTMFKCKGDLK